MIYSPVLEYIHRITAQPLPITTPPFHAGPRPMDSLFQTSSTVAHSSLYTECSGFHRGAHAFPPKLFMGFIPR